MICDWICIYKKGIREVHIYIKLLTHVDFKDEDNENGKQINLHKRFRLSHACPDHYYLFRIRMAIIVSIYSISCWSLCQTHANKIIVVKLYGKMRMSPLIWYLKFVNAFIYTWIKFKAFWHQQLWVGRN